MKKIILSGFIALSTFCLSGCSFISDVSQIYKEIMNLDSASTLRPEIEHVQQDIIYETENTQKETNTNPAFDLLNITAAKYQLSYVIYNDPSGHRICGFINIETQETIELDVDSVEDDYHPKFPQHYLDYASHLDFVICHQGDKILTWDAYIRNTEEIVNNKNNEELAEILHLNAEFNEYAYLVPFVSPDVIRLSDWPEDEYVCIRLQQSENGKYILPPVLNDTFDHTAKIHFNYLSPEYNPPIGDEYCVNIHMWEPTYRELDKELIVFKWTSVTTSEFKTNNNIVNLNDYELNDIISVHFNRYFYNNTDKTITLTTSSGDQKIVIPPSFFGEVTWSLNDIIVSKIA